MCLFPVCSFLMLIFVHGMWGKADVWQPFIQHFKGKGFDCKAVDLRDGLDLHRACFMDYLNQVKSMVGPEDVVIGHSMGGLIVQKIAEQNLIQAGIGICPAPPKGIRMQVFKLSTLRYLPALILKRPFKPNYSYLKWLMFNCLNEDTSHSIYDDLVAESAVVTYELLMNKIQVDESKVGCPLFFIGTRMDHASPPGLVEQIADKYNASYTTMEGCHYIFTQWQEIADTIYNYITKKTE